eukprot:jgi/Ulvmu1/1024/UM104_0009.1
MKRRLPLQRRRPVSTRSLHTLVRVTTAASSWHPRPAHSHAASRDGALELQQPNSTACVGQAIRMGCIQTAEASWAAYAASGSRNVTGSTRSIHSIRTAETAWAANACRRTAEARLQVPPLGHKCNTIALPPLSAVADAVADAVAGIGVMPDKLSAILQFCPGLLFPGFETWALHALTGTTRGPQ